MRRIQKSKKDKVPKITEEEYAKYISSLRNETGKKESASPPAVREGAPNNEM